MKANELRQKTEKQLQDALYGLLREQFSFRMQKGTGQLTRPSQIKAVRRDVARIKTVLNEKKAVGGAK